MDITHSERHDRERNYRERVARAVAAILADPLLNTGWTTWLRWRISRRFISIAFIAV